VALHRLLITRLEREGHVTTKPLTLDSTVTLNNGVEMPRLGFGVFQVPDDQTAAAVAAALRVGYRAVDTAAIYGNETGVALALADSGIPRDELFVTTKLWNADQGYDNARAAADASLSKLGLTYVDLYLIHWPTPARGLFVETWRALERIHKQGKTRAIGVSNFEPGHLQALLDAGLTVPAVNQVELHPALQQPELREFHARHGIATEAWAPLAQGAVLGEPVITAIANRLNHTPAQVVLRWHLQLGNVVIPKSVTPARIAANFELFDFALTDADMDAISGLNTDTRNGPHPSMLN
jgi:diketogulonate reductase-like aldo/keto reductase